MKRNIILSIITIMAIIIDGRAAMTSRLGGRIGYDAIAGNNASINIYSLADDDLLVYSWDMKIGDGEWTRIIHSLKKPYENSFTYDQNCLVRRVANDKYLLGEPAYSNSIHLYKITDSNVIDVYVSGNNALLVDVLSLYNTLSSGTPVDRVKLVSYRTSPVPQIIDDTPVPMPLAVGVPTIIDSKKVTTVEEKIAGKLYLLKFVAPGFRVITPFRLTLQLADIGEKNIIYVHVNINQSPLIPKLQSCSIQDVSGQTESMVLSGNTLRIITNGKDIEGPYGTLENLSIWWEKSYDRQTWDYITGEERYCEVSVDQDTYIRRCISDGVDIAYSNIYSITSDLQSLSGGQIVTNMINRYGSCDCIISSTQEAIFSGVNDIEYAWEKSINSIEWQQIPNSNLPYHIPEPSPETIFYRRKATYSRYEAYSNVVAVDPYFLSGGIVGLQKNSWGRYSISNLAYPEWCQTPDMVEWEQLIGGVWLDCASDGDLDLPPDSETWAEAYRRKITYNGCSGYSNEVRPFTYDGGNVVLAQKINDNGTYTSIFYYDGLGRPSQTVDPSGAVRSANGAMKDIVTPIVYDNMGRDDAIVYLHFADNSLSSGSERSDFVPLQQNYYTNLYDDDGEYAYKTNMYDSSPLDRIDRSMNVGKVFKDNDKNITFQYQINDVNEVHRIISNGGRSIKVEGCWNKSSLTKTVTIDEDGHTTIIFKDFLGNMILSRQMNGDERVDTYYVYDNHNRLCAVVPPEEFARISRFDNLTEIELPIAPSESELAVHCYYYAYDNAGNCIEKQIPGSEPVYFIYNIDDKTSTDYPVAMQDGNLRKNNTWLFMDYDKMRRLIKTSYVTIREDSTNDIARHTFDSRWELMDYFTFYLSNSKSINEKLYDNYQTSDSETFSPIPNIVSELDIDRRVKGLITTERIYLLDSNVPDKYLYRTYYYDKYGRVIQTIDKYPSGSIARYSTKYDMLGNVLATHESHTRNGVTDYMVTYNELDHRGRLLRDSIYVSNGSCPVSTTYTYDDLGTLKSRVINGIDEHLSYNIQGWLSSKSVYVPYADSEDKGYMPFGETIKYFDPSFSDGIPSYSGNIAEICWSPNNRRSGTYHLYYYDLLSRLVNTKQYINGTMDQTYTENESQYDRNGNIYSMTRFHNNDNITHLNYGYANNRLHTVVGNRTDSNIMACNSITDHLPFIPKDSLPFELLTNKASLYKDDPTVYSGAEYKYDSNGNIVYDGYHRLNIRYNHLNLPRKISRGDDILVNYVYLADGTKYSALKSDGSGFVYEGSFIYKRSEDGSLILESIPFSNGRFVANSNGTLTPKYFITDHLSSVRAVVDENLTVEEANDYYQFGKHVEDADSQISDNRYRYNGKENQEFFDLPYLDYGARLYDPNTGRWLEPDPLAEQYPSISPYAFCANNPVNLIDPDGRQWKTIEDEEIATQLQESIIRRLNVLDNQERKINDRIIKIQNNSKINGDTKEVLIAKQNEKLIGVSIEKNNLSDLQNGITEIGTSESLFTFQTQLNAGVGYVGTNAEGLTTIFNDGSLGNRVHETTHAVQVARGQIVVNEKGFPQIGTKLSVGAREIPAYQNQFSITGIAPSSTVGGVPNKIADITYPWLLGITDIYGNYIYR